MLSAVSLRSRLYVAGALASCSYAICRTPLLPLLARDLGADAITVGLVVGASTVSGILLKLPAGAWSDVLGRRAFLIAAGLVFALMPLAYLGVASLAALMALRFAHGSATAIFGPVASASLSDIAPLTHRATWLSGFAMVQGMGQVAAPVVAGALVARAGYDTAFVAATLVGISVPLILAGWPPHAAAATGSRLRAFGGGVGAVMRDRAIVITSATQAAMLAASNALASFAPLYAAEVIGLDAVTIGLLFGLHAITGLAARPIAGVLADRFGRRPLIAGGLAACGVALASLPLAANAIAVGIVLCTSATGLAMTTTAASALVTDRARQANYGAAHGVFGTVYDAGDALGPIGAGVLVATIGYVGMFEVAAALAIAAAVLFLLLEGAWVSVAPGARTAPR